MGTRKTEGSVTQDPEAQQGIPWTAKQHVAHALEHLRTAASLTSDPALQGELNRSHDRLQRRLDLTHGG